MNENCVFVVDTTERPLTPCRPAQARRLMRQGKAAVYRRFPFTLILKEAYPDAPVDPLNLKLDPGSKTTGIVLVNRDNRVIYAAELEHRGQAISKSLATRAALRRGRRHRKTRYRKPGLPNNRRPAGWLAPSLRHRVFGTLTWVNRFRRLAPVSALSAERVKFDTQMMQNPEISGVEYQQGTLAGFEVREYLLEKWGRNCAYCGAKDLPLEVEHVRPKARGGSNRVSNLCLSCRDCNEHKGTRSIEDFLAKKPELLARILKQLKAPLKDAAAVNGTRNELVRELLLTGLTVETGSGARTKYNRRRLDNPKAHWIDAACVGVSGETVTLDPDRQVLRIKATGHGSRQRCNSDSYGFPGKAAPRRKRFAGFQTGDLVSADIPTGKYAGKHSGRIAIRHRPSFRITTATGTFDVHPKYLTITQRSDGYAYSLASPPSKLRLDGVPARESDGFYKTRKTNNPTIDIYTDGACYGNPGPGGWGAVLVSPAQRRQICGGESNTTSQRMELMAAIRALEELSEPTEVFLHSDCHYLQKGMSFWLSRWIQSGWTTRQGNPLQNRDLWERLIAAANPHKISWIWIKGHAGYPGNELADWLAKKGRDAHLKQNPDGYR